MYIPLIVLGAGIMMIACEVARSDRSWPRVAGWWIRATVLNGVQGLMVLTAGVAWGQWMIQHRLWSADGLGFIFQRPESHCVHHQEGVHWYNFADLPLWDMLFGTFRNPRQWQARCGFGPEREHRLFDMLAGVDVNRPDPLGA